MSATKELRHLLDERGIEWCGDEVTYWSDADALESVFRDNALDISLYGITPAQAIEATLGRGECELHDCEGSFSAVNRPVWRCDCGAFMTQYTDATTYHKPRYCPNCGREVVKG